MGKETGVLDGVPTLVRSPRTDEVSEQLARITTSRLFRGAPRLSHFLIFIVEATLAGRAATIKAYTIAIEALGRGADFDPQIDPIVRVEAGRLRAALMRYYSGEGRHDPIVIEVPRGTYVPLFRRSDAQWPAGAMDTRRQQAAFFARAASAPGPDIVARTQQIRRRVAEFEALFARQREQLHSLRRTLLSAQHAVKDSRELLAASVACGLACGAPPPLLPTAPPAQPHEVFPPDGRQQQSEQQAEGAAAARAVRPRPGGDRGDAADAGDDPPRL